MGDGYEAGVITGSPVRVYVCVCLCIFLCLSRSESIITLHHVRGGFYSHLKKKKNHFDLLFLCAHAAKHVSKNTLLFGAPYNF